MRDKVAALPAILAEAGAAGGAVAYIGDDVNDLEAMRAVAAAGGLVAAPADAMPEVRDLVHFRTGARGGHGAFRDFAEWIIALRTSPTAGRRFTVWTLPHSRKHCAICRERRRWCSRTRN